MIDPFIAAYKKIKKENEPKMILAKMNYFLFIKSFINVTTCILFILSRKLIIDVI